MADKNNGEALRYYHRVRDYEAVFSSSAGKRVLADLERAYTHTFHPDPYVSAFKQGQRQVVLDIKRLLELANDPQFTEESITDYFTTLVDDEGFFHA